MTEHTHVKRLYSYWLWQDNAEWGRKRKGYAIWQVVPETTDFIENNRQYWDMYMKCVYCTIEDDMDAVGETYRYESASFASNPRWTSILKKDIPLYMLGKLDD